MARYGEVIQRQHFCHHGDTICHPKSGDVTIKLHGTSTCRCNNNAIFSDSYFQVAYRLRMPATLISAAADTWQFMPNWKDGSTVEFIICRV